MDKLIYLDNTSTVFPKPGEIIDSMCRFYREKGVNPGRSGYDLCLEAEEVVTETRKLLTRLFNGTDPNRLIFTYNASDALNIIINGLLKAGDHVITSNLEHNSVLRPLYHMYANKLIEIDYIPFDSNGYIDPADIEKKVKNNTRLVIINHGSNAIGTVQPIGEIGRICREKKVIFATDAAQTAGIVPIDMQQMNIDVVAFTGHKSLLGPTGIGGLYVRDGIEITQTRSGGTGVHSAQPFHLIEYPFRLEVGTLNVLGIAGLNAGQKYITREGMNNIYRKEMKLLQKLQQGFSEIEHITLLGTMSLDNRLPILAINIDGYDAADVGILLDGHYNIAVRTGLHCAPKVHEQLGTLPGGAVRFGIGPMNSESDISQAIEAVKELASERVV